jgi:cytoskeletal protein CcmA (bactofilin family)
MWKRDQSASNSAGRSLPDQDTIPPTTKVGDGGAVVMDLGKSVVIKGELSGSEDFTLYGQMDGSIRLPDHTLTIGPHADIRAEVLARSVVVMGAVTGNVTAADKVEIQSTGFVNGDIVAPRIAVAEGGGLHGRVARPGAASVKNAQESRPAR